MSGFSLVILFSLCGKYFVGCPSRPCKGPISHQPFNSLVLASTDVSWQQNYFSDSCRMVIFSSILFPHLLPALLLCRKASSSLFFIDSYFIQWTVTHFGHCFDIQIVSDWPVGAFMWIVLFS